MNWQNARFKADILAHPLYEQLLSAHVACLRIVTPVDQLPRIDAQLAQSQHVVAKYSALGGAAQGMVGDDKELDQFMVHNLINFHPYANDGPSKKKEGDEEDKQPTEPVASASTISTQIIHVAFLNDVYVDWVGVHRLRTPTGYSYHFP